MRNFGTLFVLSLLLATPSTAQVGRGPIPAASWVPAPQSSLRKKPAIAGALSFVSGFVLLPGMGSVYAGNSGHGMAHFMVGIVAAGVFVVSINGAFQCYERECTPQQRNNARKRESLGPLALGAYVINYLWSIATAVSDANAFNRRPQHLRSLRFQPAVVDLSSRKTASSSLPSRQRRIGLGLAATF